MCRTPCKPNWSTEHLIELLAVCCDVFGVLAKEVLAGSRAEECLFACQSFCYLADQRGYYHQDIAKIINGHYSVVSHAVNKAEQLIEINNPKFMKGFKRLV